MSVVEVRGLRELARVFGHHQAAREAHIKAATRRAAQQAVAIVKRHVPVAFGELREAVTAQGSAVVVAAPHAAAVEVGSRPHTPPLEPLIAWVRLRGLQALLSDRERGRLPGSSTRLAAERVGAELAAHVRGGASDADAPRRVAYLIQQKIARSGTMPHGYTRASLPEIRSLLDGFVREALRHTQ